MRVELSKFETMASDTFQAIEDLQKDVMGRASVKEVISLIKNKTEVEDVNKALTQIHEELDTKIGNDIVSI